jgi:hypothetical protein
VDDFQQRCGHGATFVSTLGQRSDSSFTSVLAPKLAAKTKRLRQGVRRWRLSSLAVAFSRTRAQPTALREPKR